MREAVRDDFLLVKRSAGLTRLLKTTKWQKLPIALFREDNTHWLILFTDKTTSISFFNPPNSRANGHVDSMQVKASELLLSLRSSNASSQNSPHLRNILELIPLSQVISLESSTKSTKGKQTGIPEAPDLIYCLTIDYSTSTSSTSDKQRRIHFGSTEHNSIIEWLTVLEQKRLQSRRDLTPQSCNANEVYSPLSQENVFPVKLMQFPEACTAYEFRANAHYRLRIEVDAMTLLGADETSHVIVTWPLTLVRGFGKPSGTRCDKFWFEAGRRCSTGAGVFSFESKQAVQMYDMAHKQVSNLNQRIQRANSAPPAYTEVVRDSPLSTTDFLNQPHVTSAITEATQAEAAPPPPPKAKTRPITQPLAPRRNLQNTPSITLPSRAGVPPPPLPTTASLYPTNLLNSIVENDDLPKPLLTPPVEPSAPPPPVYESGESFVPSCDTTGKQCETDGAAVSKGNINDIVLKLSQVLSTSNNRDQRPNSQIRTPTSPGVPQTTSASNQHEFAISRNSACTFDEHSNATTKVKPLFNVAPVSSAPSSPPPLTPDQLRLRITYPMSSNAAPLLSLQTSGPPDAMFESSDVDDTNSCSSNEWKIPPEMIPPNTDDASSDLSVRQTDAKPSNGGVYMFASQWQPANSIASVDLIQLDTTTPAPRDAAKADVIGTKGHDQASLDGTMQVLPKFSYTQDRPPPPIPQRPPNMKLPVKLPR